mgnify:CR=1 FL=1
MQEKVPGLFSEAENKPGTFSGQGKVVTARHRRRVVEHLKAGCVSERRACRLAGISRVAMWKPLKGRDDAKLRSRIKQLAERYPRYGYPTLHHMLRAEGLVQNPKRTYRIYREEGLQVRRKRRKKLTRPRIPLSVPTGVNERWSVDFVSDQLANGRRIRVFNIVDDFSRECVAQVVDFSISGLRLTRELDRISERRPLPSKIVCDNGPELTCKAMFFWAKKRGIKLHFISPANLPKTRSSRASTASSASIVSISTWFASIDDARAIIDTWRKHYNHVRPHRSLGKKPPAVFAREAA